MSKIYIMDTNILYCYLGINGEVQVGSGKDWTKDTIQAKIDQAKAEGAKITLPLPVVIEIGNHVGNNGNLDHCDNLIDLIKQSFDDNAPWHSFQEQNVFWKNDRLREILDQWRSLVTTRVAFGDFLLLALKNYYVEQNRGYNVEIWTGDATLASFQDVPASSYQEWAPSPRGIRNK